MIRVEEPRLILLSGMGGDMKHAVFPSISAPVFGPDPLPTGGVCWGGGETEIGSLQVDLLTLISPCKISSGWDTWRAVSKTEGDEDCSGAVSVAGCCLM